jgi:hypothetical protein
VESTIPAGSIDEGRYEGTGLRRTRRGAVKREFSLSAFDCDEEGGRMGRIKVWIPFSESKDSLEGGNPRLSVVSSEVAGVIRMICVNAVASDNGNSSSYAMKTLGPIICSSFDG